MGDVKSCAPGNGQYTGCVWNRQTQILHIKTERCVHTNICPGLSGFEFKWNITFNKHLNMYYFNYKWHNTFTMQVSNLIRASSNCSASHNSQ